jgi:predicted alpha/beta hydrolase family esterase
MKALLFHGTGGNNTDYFWFADTKKHLEANGYEVWWPQLPNAHKPELQETLKFVLDNMPALDEQSIVIGHSSACPLILSLLERIDTSIARAILVSGFYESLGSADLQLMLQKSYAWQKIKANAKEIYLLNSDNDPWGCTDQRARPVAEKLQAPLTVMFGQGHMGSSKFKQPYIEFPLVKKLLRAQ